MRILIAFLLAALTATAAFAETISVTDVGTHVGQTVTVEGVVSGVYTARSGVTFIDMGGPYPNNLFAGVIFSEDMAKVGDVSGLTGKTVDLSGTIKLYKGKPEIILKSGDQIKVH
jgi:DNA/RNA endonuclease YhcR with UshA esterase domain